MAKVKQNKSVRELLQEAIIPNNQAPFSISDNWCWVNLKMLVKHRAGNSKLIKGKLSPVGGNGLYRAYSASGQDVFYKDFAYEGEAVIVSAVGARCGKAFLAYGKWSAIANTHIIFPNGLNCKFLFYFLNNENWWIKSGSAQPFVVVNDSLERPFALPPLQEQMRIVDKIDSLFSKLDEAKELIQKSLDEFENRKAAILYKAIHGQLIKKTTSWNKVILKDVVYEFQYGTSKKSEKRGKAIVIRMGNLQAGKIDWNDLAYSNDDEDILKYKLQKGDVLFNRTNSAALVGKTSIYEDERLAIFAGYLIRLKYDKNLIIGRFLNYLLNSQDAKEYCSRVKTDAVNQSNINAKKIAMFSFMLPSLEEQQEIVRILDSFFEKEDKSKELLDMIDQIEEMKKSILSRAFRGELGTHSDDDEPAIELLKKII